MRGQTVLCNTVQSGPRSDFGLHDTAPSSLATLTPFVRAHIRLWDVETQDRFIGIAEIKSGGWPIAMP